MPVPVSGQVGEQVISPGVTTQPLRQGRLADVVVSECSGRFYELAYAGRLYSGGMTATSISNATFTTATLSNTGTPIIGVWNPGSSVLNLVILQAILTITVTAGTATGIGTAVWTTSTGNNAISTGNAPLNRKTLAASGSVAKDMTGVALTGITNNPVIRMGSALYGGLIKNASSVETAVGQNIGMAGVSVENFDGSLIVPPGGFLGLFCTTTPVAHTAAAGLIWAEVPV